MPIGSVIPQDAEIVRLLLKRAAELARENDTSRLKPREIEILRACCLEFLEATK